MAAKIRIEIIRVKRNPFESDRNVSGFVWRRSGVSNKRGFPLYSENNATPNVSRS